MSVTQIASRVAAAVVYAVTGYVVAAGVLDVAAWKAALMSGLFVLLEIARKLAAALKDGRLTNVELNEIFKH